MTTPAPSSAPHPLILEPILKPKVWGGRRLESLGKALPADEPIGESWELADLPTTSASGGGGDAAHSVIANGPLAGKTVGDALALWGTDLLGNAQPTADGSFPLLVKYLDAREHLSVQVHPSPEFAASHPEAHLKTESWYIVDAEPGAELFIGFKDGISKADLDSAIRSGTVPNIMRSIPAVPGECHTLPSGTVHALGAGVLVAEVQTPSDTTFRVYDWTNEYDRPDRELHIEQALACASFDSAPQPIPASGTGAMGSATTTRVASTEFYSIDAVRASCTEISLAETTDSPLVIMLPKTMGASLVGRTVAYDEVHLSAGQSVLIPACCTADTALRAGPGTEVLVASLG